ncbi:MAG: hypothetical protein F6K41_15190 [Symploca sp. SIO3E6]|nr:hypothetical protein [Caldora sp. SIO3E6]
MGLSIEDRFGSNATLVNGVLQVQVSDLAVVGLNNADPTPDQVFGALVLLNEANQPTSAADDPTVGVTIEKGFKNFVDRDSTPQIEQQYTVSLLKSDTSGTIDPDDIGA